MTPATPAQTSYRHIWRLSWPVMISNISLPLVGAVDVAMMGHLPDPAFVGGVALGSLVFNFLYLAFSFLRMGTTGLTALAAGANQMDEVGGVFLRGQFIALVGGLGLIACLPVILWAAGLVLSASADSLGHMQTYLWFRIWGLPATLANAVMLGSLFGLQRMRLCMVQLLFVNLLNIALNFIFVLGLSWQVEGVALASVCAEWAGLALMIGIVLRPNQLMMRIIRTLSLRQVFGWEKWSGLLAIARDLSLRTLLIWGVEAVLIAKAAALGDVELASIQLMLVLFGFIAFGLDGFAHATEALTGRFVGAADPASLRLMIWRSCILAGLAALMITGFLYLFKPVLLPLLTSQPALLQMTSDIWVWGLAMPVAAFLAFQMDGVYVGAASSRHMRNGMVLAFILFTGLASFFDGYHLDGLLFVFILYLIIRGIYLAAFLPSLLSLAEPKPS